MTAVKPLQGALLGSRAFLVVQVKAKASSALVCSSAVLPIIQIPMSSFGAADTSDTAEDNSQNFNLVSHTSSTDADPRHLPQPLRDNAAAQRLSPSQPPPAGTPQAKEGRAVTVDRPSQGSAVGNRRKGQELPLGSQEQAPSCPGQLRVLLEGEHPSSH